VPFSIYLYILLLTLLGRIDFQSLALDNGYTPKTRTRCSVNGAGTRFGNSQCWISQSQGSLFKNLLRNIQQGRVVFGIDSRQTHPLFVHLEASFDHHEIHTFFCVSCVFHDRLTMIYDSAPIGHRLRASRRFFIRFQSYRNSFLGQSLL
jgi:hypothetical protein